MELIYLVIFIFGAMIGSYINVIRLRGFIQSCVGRSYCPNCNKQLNWYHLIPILSFLFLKGECSNCKNKIEPKYLFFELGFGFLFMLIYYIWSL